MVPLRHPTDQVEKRCGDQEQVLVRTPLFVQIPPQKFKVFKQELNFLIFFPVKWIQEANTELM